MNEEMTRPMSDDSGEEVLEEIVLVGRETKPLPRIDEPAVSLSAAGTATKRTGENRIRRSTPAFLWVIAVTGFLAALLSLTVNAVLIRELLLARQEGLRLLDTALAELEEFSLDGLRVAYTFSDTIHYSGTIPISQTIDFPFQGNIPFRGEVPITINAGLLGSQTIRVPVDTSVYVNTVVRVPVRMDFPFDVQMPVQLPIDLEFSAEDFPELWDLLGVFRQLLLEVRALFWR